ncbi:hypothetical protein BKCO1_7900023 [Neofusicoccum parvum]|uniref:Uncharacterized protein n=1 Tax=Neofusicoccum parvum TaxID=310453 RepID=A0ACB5S843_9PEZI|nr:hypothetical protein BKCO1_7900023 [Neofusicoccum parvum]
MQSHTDLPADWKGFVKIPSVHTVSEGNYSWDPNEWRDIDYSKPVSYSSLIGIPVADLPERSDSNVTFQLESRHWAINCSSTETTTMNLESVQSSGWNYAYLTNLGLPDNTKKQEQAWPLKFISLRGSPSESFSNEGLRVFRSGKMPELPVNLAYCSIRPQDVVSKVSCTGASCNVTSMRFLNPVPLATGPGVFSNLTSLDESSNQALPDKDVWSPTYWDDDDNDSRPASGDILSSNLGGGGRGMGGAAVMGLRLILDTLPLVSSQTSADSFTEITASQNFDSAVPYDLYMSDQGPTYAEAWLAGRIEGYHSNRYMSWTDFSELPLKEFSARLEALVNTYWQSFYMIPYLDRDLLHASNFDDEDRLGIPFRNITDRSVPFNRVPAIAKIKGPNVCICNLRWAFVLLGTSVILFIAAVATVVLDIITIAPDIFGFTSSCTRDNVYMARFAEGSYLGGLARARALQNVMVRIGDVKDQHTVGHVALTTNLDESKKLRRDKEYD